MAPTITSTIPFSKDHQSMTHKLRKPLVEKLRRERINSSIEQLKALLGPEFLKQQPDSKLEKADILEMTVCFMRQLRSCRPTAVDQGYSRCVQEAVHFLSKDEGKIQSQTQLMAHFQNLQSPSQKSLSEASPVQPIFNKATLDNSPVWRPW